MQETIGCDHDARPVVDALLVDDSENATVVIDVRVGVRDGHHVANSEMRVDEGLGGARRLGGGEGVDDQPARLRGDETDHGGVVSANLVHAFANLVQAVFGVQLRLSPQRRVHAGGRVAVDEREIRGVPTDTHQSTGTFVQDGSVVLGDEALARPLEIGVVGPRKAIRQTIVGGHRVGGGGSAFGHAVMLDRVPPKRGCAKMAP